MNKEQIIEYRKKLIETMTPDNEFEENPHEPTEEEYEKAEEDLRKSFEDSINECIKNNDIKGLLEQLGQYSGLVRPPDDEFDNGDNDYYKPFDCCDIVSLLQQLCVDHLGLNQRDLENMYDPTKPYIVSDSSSDYDGISIEYDFDGEPIVSYSFKNGITPEEYDKMFPITKEELDEQFEEKLRIKQTLR